MHEKLGIVLPPEINPSGRKSFISPAGSQDLGSGQLKVELEGGGQVRFSVPKGNEEEILKLIGVVDKAASGKSAKTVRVLCAAAMRLQELLDNKYEVDLTEV